ncbi:MAG: permease [Candidatus Woesearchaeota archaeon]
MVFYDFATFVVNTLGLEGQISDSVHFFIYDTTKILTLMFLIILAVSYLRTYFTGESIRNYLKGKRSIVGYILAALLGIVSPFCSCSTIPLFLGFVAAKIPFGMIITFLFVSPMVNSAAAIIMFGTLGPLVTILYVLGGLLIGILGGFILNKFNFEKYLIDFNLGSVNDNEEKITKKERFQIAKKESKNIILNILPYVFIGVGIGSIIHGFLPESIIQSYLSGSYSVPLSVIVGVPIYTNIMGVIPIAESLILKGLPIGTAVSFMMSVSALSLPQFIMLKKVMKKELIIAYGVLISLGIIIIGVTFNFIFSLL